jgi:hypothetical protein
MFTEGGFTEDGFTEGGGPGGKRSSSWVMDAIGELAMENGAWASRFALVLWSNDLRDHYGTVDKHQRGLLRGHSRICLLKKWRAAMIRVVAIAFALAVASTASAVPLAPVQQPESMITTVRQVCGAGMHRVNGVCVRTHARRAASRCARGVTC